MNTQDPKNQQKSKSLSSPEQGSGNFQESKKFPFLKRASSNRALNFLENFRKFPGNFWKFPGNFLETVRVVTGQETVRVGMWSQPTQLEENKE